jgi:hypothetical protein
VNCNPTSWAWSRLLRVVTDAIALQINYCESQVLLTGTATVVNSDEQLHVHGK